MRSRAVVPEVSVRLGAAADRQTDARCSCTIAVRTRGIHREGLRCGYVEASFARQTAVGISDRQAVAARCQIAVIIHIAFGIGDTDCGGLIEVIGVINFVNNFRIIFTRTAYGGIGNCDYSRCNIFGQSESLDDSGTTEGIVIHRDTICTAGQFRTGRGGCAVIPSKSIIAAAVLHFDGERTVTFTASRTLLRDNSGGKVVFLCNDHGQNIKTRIVRVSYRDLISAGGQVISACAEGDGIPLISVHIGTEYRATVSSRAGSRSAARYCGRSVLQSLRITDCNGLDEIAIGILGIGNRDFVNPGGEIISGIISADIIRPIEVELGDSGVLYIDNRASVVQTAQSIRNRNITDNRLHTVRSLAKVFDRQVFQNDFAAVGTLYGDIVNACRQVGTFGGVGVGVRPQVGNISFDRNSVAEIRL